MKSKADQLLALVVYHAMITHYGCEMLDEKKNLEACYLELLELFKELTKK